MTECRHLSPALSLSLSLSSTASIKGSYREGRLYNIMQASLSPIQLVYRAHIEKANSMTELYSQIFLYSLLTEKQVRMTMATHLLAWKRSGQRAKREEDDHGRLLPSSTWSPSTLPSGRGRPWAMGHTFPIPCQGLLQTPPLGKKRGKQGAMVSLPPPF